MENWKNQTLKVAAVNHAGFHMKKIGDKWMGLDGKDFEILKILSEKMHFRYELVSPIDQQWGSCDDQGNCTGMIGMVIRQGADMAISSLTPTEVRAKFVEFSSSYFQDEITFVTRKPDTKLDRSVFFAEPFEPQVWISVACFLAIFIVVTKILERLRLLPPKIFSVKNLIAILLRQDVPLEMTTKESTILMAFLLVMADCACKMYECVLTSETSLNSASRPLDTIEDMVRAIKKHGYVVGADFGTSFYNQIMTSDLEYLKIFANSMRKKGFETHRTFEEGLIRAYNLDYATVGPSEILQKAALEAGLDLSKLHFASDYLFLDPFAMAYAKNFRFKHAINRWLVALASSDLITKWDMESNWKMKKATTADRSKRNYIDINDVYQVVVVLIIGQALAFSVLIVEITHSRMSKLYPVWRNKIQYID